MNNEAPSMKPHGNARSDLLRHLEIELAGHIFGPEEATRVLSYLAEFARHAGVDPSSLLARAPRRMQLRCSHAGLEVIYSDLVIIDEHDSAKARLSTVAAKLRDAKTGLERRAAAREFLAALAALIICLLRFLVRALLRLLSGSLTRTRTADIPAWQPEPIDVSPQITPRGPNPALPVTTHRGGHNRSALGRLELAA
ncbi:hypothetical protein [Kitasatospora viridis]|uniref:hypothetical protein n=1 Tax=Kitasatospora viridis TaxID=281105 RepID=UPI0011A59DE5|nr:hypothetical protein [Kitasatospora viridis]